MNRSLIFISAIVIFALSISKIQGFQNSSDQPKLNNFKALQYLQTKVQDFL